MTQDLIKIEKGALAWAQPSSIKQNGVGSMGMEKTTNVNTRTTDRLL